MQIEVVESASLDAHTRDELMTLCRAAYDEELTGYLEDIGPGTHLLGRVEGALVSHVMVVARAVQVSGCPMLHTAYIELVATHPGAQRRGHGSRLMEATHSRLGDFDFAALSPSDEAFAFYERLGWEWWRGPLAVREAAGLVPSPDEVLMVRRLPRTPVALDTGAALSIEWRAGEVW